MINVMVTHMENIFVEMFEGAVRSVPDETAIIYGDKRETIKELDERSNQLAHALLDLGVKREDRVCIVSYNNNQFLEAMFAAWKVAAIPIYDSVRHYENELRHVIDSTDTTAVVLHEELVERMSHIRPDLNKVKGYIVIREKENVPDDMLEYEELISRYPKTMPELDWPQLGDEDIVLQLMTGGTTGYPKGVQFKQKTVIGMLLEVALPDIGDILPSTNKWLANAADRPWLGDILANRSVVQMTSKLINSLSPLLQPGVLSAMLPLLIPLVQRINGGPLIHPLTGGRMRVIVLSPLAHAWGFALQLLGPLMGGSVSFLTKKSYDPHEALEIMEREKINMMVAIGDAHIRPMVGALDEKHYDLSSLGVIWASGMASSPDIKRRFIEHAPGCLFWDIYVSSEVHDLLIRPYTSSDKDFDRASWKPSPWMKVLNERREEVKPGEIGEVVIHRKYLFDGYYKDLEKTAKAIRTIDGERWLFQGDFATVDEEGKITLLGRGSDCINTGGEKVYPEEVEVLIKTNPKVKDAGVVGIPDEKWGEMVVGIVELKKGEGASEEEMINFCRGEISGYKIPKRFIFTDVAPVTVVGKIDHKEMRKIAEREIIGG